MKISTKLIVAQAISVALVFAAITPSYLAFQRIERQNAFVVGTTLPIVQALEQLRFTTVRIVSSTSEYGMISTIARIGGGIEGLEDEGEEQGDAEEHEVAGGIELFNAALDEYRTLLSQPTDEPIDDLASAGEVLLRLSDTLTRLIDDQASPAVLMETKEEFEEAEMGLLALIDRKIARHVGNLSTQNSELAEAIHASRIELVLFAALAVAAAVLAGFVASASIARPIEGLTEAARRLAGGDFSFQPPARTRGEVGMLADAFARMCRDIEALLGQNRAAVAAAEASEARFRDVAEASSDWIFETDAELRLTFVSERFTEVTGLLRDDALGRPLTEIVDVEHEQPEGSSVLADLAAEAAFRDARCSYDGIDGERRYGWLSARPTFDGSGAFCGYRGTARDVTREVHAEEQARHLALHDPLTGLANRKLMAERFATLLGAQDDGGRVVLFCIDLDRFKEVNDSLGHNVGDKLLVEISERIIGVTGPNDVVARLGGDEFCVIFETSRVPEEATRRAKELLKAIAAPMVIDGHTIMVSGSIGIAAHPDDGTAVGDLYKAADLALYRSKADGRNTFRFFEEEMNAESERRRQLENDLVRAVENEEFQVFYQPLVDAASGRLIAAEALVRWQSADRGLVPPGDFIQLAEETGLIVPIGEWVLRQACADALRWPELFVSVNFSVVQFQRTDVSSVVAKALSDTGLPPCRLQVEITESILLGQTERALRELAALRKLGVRLALDDFGTGYSSLSYLQRFKFDKIKLDRSFVQDLSTNPDADAIVRAVIGLARSLRIKSTAEGVETEEQRTFLLQQGCDELQGFGIGRPARAAVIDDMLAADARECAA